MDTDVLVVGAGPTGLMMANQLGRRGVRAMIIDRHSGPARQTRALGVQARTLEIYSHLGVADKALEWGKRATGADMWARGRPAARIPLGDIGQGLSPYPYLLILGQDDNERLLGEILRHWGMAVQWNTELVGLAQEPDRVRVTLKHSDGTSREMTAAWVAGCDGANSVVRGLSGIQFQGAPYEHVFFVADTQVTGPMVPDELNVYLWRRGFHLFFPLRGGKEHWRVVGIVPPALRGKDDLKLDDVVPSLREEAGTGLSFQGCSWFSTYRIHHRRAERFRDRRCFLSGDAAHIHSPVGAQGMNTGLQDAYNLAWKLALVVSGTAGPALLDSYEAERIPVARSLLSTTDRGFSLIVSDSRLAQLFRTRLLHDFPDRHSVPRRPSLANPAGPAPSRAAGRRSLPVAAGQALAGRPRRGPVSETRRHEIQSHRDRPARPSDPPVRSRQPPAHARDPERFRQRPGARARQRPKPFLLPPAPGLLHRSYGGSPASRRRHALLLRTSRLSKAAGLTDRWCESCPSAARQRLSGEFGKAKTFAPSSSRFLPTSSSRSRS
jgi:2-polyprenyl-6-methoxyphenol hydroxylase-like FAD-dependent oxidoreductase